ncbi:sterol desaturase family protein [marine gamma proteobacterium HTCC2143]|uniref:Sterol desaturase family protein n=1 Tax=marine gamma proteobacterium HTCC2143 TaxID=247633 RepID=A0YAS5_9GAMM|nr:sterol desaturase family protein [marine gamma proteobacterium HTCC2143]
MDIVSYATPFFLLAIVLELGWGFFRKNNTYRLNDSVNSLSLGMLSTLAKLAFISIGALVFARVENQWALFAFDQESAVHWVLALLFYDLCYYWFHRISHERQIFWGSHVVHHQSEDYNLSTALRQTSTGIFITWIFFIPCFLLGIPLYMYVTIASGHLVYQFWIHTQHIPKLGFLEWFLITPSNHRVHHAQNPQYVDKNYGGLLIIWDRLFGTFAEEDDNEKVIYGLRTPLQSWNPLWANIHIFSSMVSDATKTENIRDKVAVLWSRTGSRPSDVAKKYPVEKTNLDNFRKYNPQLTTVSTVAVVLHYMLLLVYFLWFTALVPEMSYLARCANMVILTLSAVTIGTIIDQHSKMMLVECTRLLIIGVIIITAYNAGNTPMSWLYYGLAYSLITSILTVISIRQTNDFTARELA